MTRDKLSQHWWVAEEIEAIRNWRKCLMVTVKSWRLSWTFQWPWTSASGFRWHPWEDLSTADDSANVNAVCRLRGAEATQQTAAHHETGACPKSSLVVTSAGTVFLIMIDLSESFRVLVCYMPSVIWRCWLGGRKAWLSVWSEVQMICIWSTNATATPPFLAPVKSRMVYRCDAGFGLPRLSWKKLLNGCNNTVVVVVIMTLSAFVLQNAE